MGAMNCLLVALALFFAHAKPTVVTLVTTAGEIDIEVFEKQAPLSSADFLRYAGKGLYDGATFYRVVRADNDHGTPKIEVIQGGVADDKALPPIEHETTKATGIRHTDGTVSLARGKVGTGSAAAFGRVIRGMDVVRAIQKMPADGAADSEYMKGQILSKPVVIEKAVRK